MANVMKWDKVKEMAKPYVPNAESYDVRASAELIRKCPESVFPKWMRNNIMAEYNDKCEWVIKTLKRH